MIPAKGGCLLHYLDPYGCIWLYGSDLQTTCSGHLVNLCCNCRSRCLSLLLALLMHAAMQ